MQRVAKLSDLNDIKRIWTDSFSDTEAFINWYFEKRFKEENTFVEEKNGKVVSSLQAIPYDFFFLNKIVKSEYIYGVSTLKNERNKGYSRSLFEFTLPILKKRGAMFCFLLSDIGDVYKKYGFATIGKKTLYNIDKEENTVPFNTDKISSEYLSAMKTKNAYVIRNKEEWADIKYDIEFLSDGKVIDIDNGYGLAYGNEIHEIFGKYDTDNKINSSVTMFRAVNAFDVLTEFSGYFPNGTSFNIRDEIIPENNGLYVIENGKVERYVLSKDASISIEAFSKKIFELCEENFYINFLI